MIVMSLTMRTKEKTFCLECDFQRLIACVCRSSVKLKKKKTSYLVSLSILSSLKKLLALVIAFLTSTSTHTPGVLSSCPLVAVEQAIWKASGRSRHIFFFFLWWPFFLLCQRARTEGRVIAAENLPKQSFICHGPDEKQREHQCAVWPSPPSGVV